MAVRDGKLIYHLTAVENLESVFDQGLMPRKENPSTKLDVADPDILEGREITALEAYVPFHFFAGSPFAGAVQIKHPTVQFVYICVRRTTAQANKFQIIPKHPLTGEPVNPMSYIDGFSEIDWPALEKRDYQDSDSKRACMAECLSSKTVPASKFASIYVPSRDLFRPIRSLPNCPTIHINANERMFVRK